MTNVRRIAVLIVALVTGVRAQDVPPPPPVPSPFPNGMRVVVGAGSVLARNAPSLSGTCGTPPHACTAADAVLPNTFGVVQPDPPVLDPAGWYWLRVRYDTGVVGWSTASSPDRLSALNPPQMVSGVSFRIVGDYSGPTLTAAACIVDGQAAAAIMQLQPITIGQQGTLICPMQSPGIGNHIVVIQALNGAGTRASLEFQFAVTAAPIISPPSEPVNLRITPEGNATAPATTPLQRQFEK